MTLVIALKARDGVVIAADSQATTDDELAPTRTPARKLHTLHDRIAFGIAGSAGLAQRVVLRLGESVTREQCDLPFEELRPLLHAAVNSVQKEGEAEFVEVGEDPNIGCAWVLFAGVSGGRPWVYEILYDGKDEEHPQGEAIGHARHITHYLAVSTLHYELLNSGVDEVAVLTYRAVEDSIKVDASSLGPPVQLCLVTAEGTTPADDDRIKRIRDSLSIWKEQEATIFKSLSGEAPHAAPAGDTGVSL